MVASIFAVVIGGSLGCLIRWALVAGLNTMFPALPPGTLVANLIGGYLIGVSIAYFSAHPDWAPHWRLLAMTGFLGGLTTFSAFSGEVAMLLQQGNLAWACVMICSHVFGSLVLTLTGMATVRVLSGA